MAIDRDAAYLSETLVYMEIATVRRKEREANRGCVVNQLESRLRELQDTLQRRTSYLFTPGQLTLPTGGCDARTSSRPALLAQMRAATSHYSRHLKLRLFFPSRYQVIH